MGCARLQAKARAHGLSATPRRTTDFSYMGLPSLVVIQWNITDWLDGS